MSYIFVYREKDYNRDSCCYVEDDRIGSRNVVGPCFSKGFGGNFGSGSISYDEVETYLTEEEYNDICENGLSNEILEILTSPEALEFAEEIFADEYQAMKDEFDLSDGDMQDIFDTYYLDYRDRGIISMVDDNWEALAHEKAWSWGFTNSDDDRYFDYDAFISDLQNDEELLELADGRIVNLNY